MRFKLFLGLIVFGTILAWLSWGMVIFYFDPGQAGFTGVILFFVSLFLALSGLLFLLIDLVKAKLAKDQLLLYRIRVSIRHSILFTVIVLGWALLKSQSLLRWWNFLLLVLALTVLEFFFISTQKQKNNYERETYPDQDPIYPTDQSSL
ncbi:MAG: hypothetical protein WCW26_02455 [Candidatus Buchananbacteria bacterium]